MSDVSCCNRDPQEKEERSKEPRTLMDELIQAHDFHQFTHSLKSKIIMMEKEKERERERGSRREREGENECVREKERDRVSV